MTMALHMPRASLRFLHRWLAAACACACIAGIGHAAPPAPALSAPAAPTTTLRFFTDERLDLRVNVERVAGDPVLVGSYRDPGANGTIDLTFSGAGVFSAPGGGFRMVYQHYGPLGQLPRSRGETAAQLWARGGAGAFCCLLARSDDGVTWAPESTLTELPDLANRRFDNQVMPNPGALGSVFVDTGPSAGGCPLKALIAANRYPLASQRSAVWCSADGVRWTNASALAWMAPGDDLGEGTAFAFWNPLSGRYGLSARPMWGDRRVTYHETEDWTEGTNTPPELVFEADDVDPPLAEHYGMLVVPLDPNATAATAAFLGLLYVYKTPPGAGQASGAPGVLGQCPQKYAGGRLEAQLTFSRNGRHWQRTTRDPLLGNVFGGPAAGVVTPTSALRLANGSVLLFSSATRREHGSLATAHPEDSSVLVHLVRRDGWVALQSGGGLGYVGTRVLYHGCAAPLTVNADSRHGSVRAQLTDHEGVPLQGYTYADSEVFSDDSVAWSPRWGVSGVGPPRTASGVCNTTMRLELELLNARVYAVTGDVVPMQAVQVQDWLLDKVVPASRPGF